MYTDEQLDELYALLDKSYSQMYGKYLKKVGERIKEVGNLRPTELHRLNIMNALYADVAQLKRELAKLSGKTTADIDAILMHSAEMDYTGAKELYKAKNKAFIPFSENESIKRLAKAVSRQTAGSFYNLSNTTGNLFKQDYKSIIDEAVKASSGGLASYNAEMYDVLKNMPLNLRVEYDSGHKRRLDSALRMNIIDGTREINQRMQELIGEELGCDGIEISAHALCAADHLPYQGRQYSKKEFERIQASLPRPFGKWNCKHFWQSIIIGASPPTHSEKTLEKYKQSSIEKINIGGNEVTRYQASQIQRKLETSIRSAKQQQILAKASGNERLIEENQRKIRHLTAEYNKIPAAGLDNHLPDRARVQGYRQTAIKR